MKGRSGGDLGRQLGLNILDLTPEHEGLQDLMQAMNHDNSLLSLQPLILLLGALCSLPQGVPKPFCERTFVIKDLQWCTMSGIVSSRMQGKLSDSILKI